MDEMKRCPFCGGAPELRHDYAGIGFSYIACTKCGIKTPQFPRAFDKASDKAARDYWNERCNTTPKPATEPEEGAQA